MNELLELERELGPQLQRALDAIIPTDAARFVDQRDAVSTTEATTEEVALTDASDHSLTTRSIRRRMLGVAAAVAVVLAGGVALSLRDASPSTDPGDAAVPTDSSAAPPPSLDPDKPPVVYLPTVTLPGFSLTDISVDQLVTEPSSDGTDLPPEPAHVTLHFAVDDPRPGAFVDVLSFSNIDSTTPDVIEAGSKAQGQKTERTVIHGLPAIVATSAGGAFGPLIAVSWIENGQHVTISGRTDVSDLVAFAEGLAPSTVEEARQVRRTLDATRMELPEVDRATLPNGFDLSVRTSGTGANVICLHAPIQRCQLMVTENSLAGDFQWDIQGTFMIDGTPWFIGWAYATHSPHSYRDGKVGDPIADFVQTQVGTFFAEKVSEPFTQVVMDAADTTAIYAASSLRSVDLLG